MFDKVICMKIPAILIVFLALLLTPVYPIYAQNQTISSNSAIRKQAPLQPKPLNIQRTEATRSSTLMTNSKISTREAQMKQRLARFKDQQKAQLAGNVTTNLNTINQNYTTAMLNHLNNLSQILVKLEARLIQSSAGTDTTEAIAAIDTAKKNISDANGALNIQLQKDYTISATSEGTLKSDIMGSRMQLKNDLQGNKDLIMKARQSVLEAIQLVGRTFGGNDGSN